MKALKFVVGLLNNPKFELAWAAVFLSALISHISRHTTHTADGWHTSLVGWDFAYASVMVIAIVWSVRRWWREGRA